MPRRREATRTVSLLERVHFSPETVREMADLIEKRSRRRPTPEEAEEAMKNLAGFFLLLAEIDRRVGGRKFESLSGLAGGVEAAQTAERLASTESGLNPCWLAKAEDIQTLAVLPPKPIREAIHDFRVLGLAA